MEPVGRIAGTASSLQGFVTIVGGALLGAAIGQSFDGTTVPMLAGFSVLSLLAIAVVWATEGRLFNTPAPPSTTAS
jgi:DHA1 family bicyclomycin/chloramphenicol resistance-like MFS transporter